MAVKNLPVKAFAHGNPVLFAPGRRRKVFAESADDIACHLVE